MKGLVLLLAVVLVGCAEFQTLEQLEMAALESGDWSAVEQRERLMEKRRAQRAMSCGRGRIKVCEYNGTGKQCFCSADENVRAFLDTL